MQQIRDSHDKSPSQEAICRRNSPKTRGLQVLPRPRSVLVSRSVSSESNFQKLLPLLLVLTVPRQWHNAQVGFGHGSRHGMDMVHGPDDGSSSFISNAY